MEWTAQGSHRFATVHFMNMFLAPLDERQTALLDIIFGPFSRSTRWPVWQYVERQYELRFGDGAEETFVSLPRAYAPPQMQPAYSMVWDDKGKGFLEPETVIGIRVAGLRQIAAAEQLCVTFVSLIRHFAECLDRLVVDPHESVQAELSEVDVRNAMLDASIAGHGAPPVDVAVEKILALLEREVYLGGCMRGGSPGEGWKLVVPPLIRMYRGVADADDYVGRASRGMVFGLDQPRYGPLSPLDLPQTVSFLDAIWRARFGAHLLPRVDTASAAKLTLECGTPEEFDSRMSALADVLGGVKVPGEYRDAGPLMRVERFLSERLSEEGVERVASAIATLRDVVAVRAGAQHSGAGGRAASSFRRLGLDYPPRSTQQSWESIRRLTIDALDAIREEIQASDETEA